mmetsp:Transcript_1986/g.3492  ORF Transcript_1986/g.3492 Transcript_1986/m.3492 type:complete len:288 (+) Transcript_1986:10-873(+)
MSTYVVASKANQSYLAECQILGEYIEKSTPDVSVKFVIKDASEWNEFVDSVCRSYGFEKKSCPIVYTLEGTLIGDGREFVEHIRDKYGKTLQVTKEQQKNRTKLNIDENEERMRKKKEGDSMGDKILKVLEKSKKKKVSNLIVDSFYEEVFEKGVPFQVRRTDLLRDMRVKRKVEKEDGEEQEVLLNINKTMNSPDDQLERHQQMKKQQEIEANRDKTFDEFEKTYLDHIKGKVDPSTRTGNRPESANMEDGSRAGGKTGMSNPNALDDDDDKKKTIASKRNDTLES